MNIHEYQSKKILSEYGINVPSNIIIKSLDELQEVNNQLLDRKKLFVKAQIHAGGRGKSGGVQLVNSFDELFSAVKKMLGTNLVTYQTDKKGQPVNTILIEEASNISQELYFSVLVDRETNRLTIVFSTHGGMDIEKVSEESPNEIFKVTVDPFLGILEYQIREIASKLNIKSLIFNDFHKVVKGLIRLFIENDCSLLEINPLVITKENKVMCLDAKIAFDDSSLYRNVLINNLRDTTQEDERENRAHKSDLNYIPLEGNIGCMVNGAGLAMATMDLVKIHGGEPANFLDVGGGATTERVTEAFKIILSDENVKVVLINIFGGIVRCDLIADGIIEALQEIDSQIPVVVRLEGNNAKIGLEKLNSSSLNIVAAENFEDAAKKSVIKSKEVV